ncbi:MAG: Crp/Fnr family transcriptional regulator [Ruminococcus sp.]|nr:Crp/Fnr family transcriptional regulator [Ruminococcus sp.]
MENKLHIHREIQRIFESEPATKKLTKGDIIYYQGDKAESFYYLKKGRVRVYMTSPDGVEKTLSTATQGEILGEAAFFDKMPRVSSASALTSTELVAINEPKLVTLIKESPQLALELLEIQATRIRQLSTQIDAMTFLQADGRIAQLLLQSAHTEDGKQTVSLTHEEIASTVGVSRVTVSNILNDFAKNGYVKTKYRKVVVLNTNALEEIAGV